jgi:hypothetical protein
MLLALILISPKMNYYCFLHILIKLHYGTVHSVKPLVTGWTVRVQFAAGAGLISLHYVKAWPHIPHAVEASSPGL